jgi:pimeloyl-ACP methyl ester carboxylesterase
MPTLARTAVTLAVAAAALAVVVLLAQRRLLYFPDRYGLEPAEREGRRLGFEPWRDARGGFLGWRAPHPGGSALARVVVLHGNAGSALDRGYLRDALQAPGVPALDLYLLEYPGYGPRDGAPSERSIVEATVAAIDLLAADGAAPILLAGESLGTGGAALAAAARPVVRGLLLVTPLKSVPEVARRHYPWLPGFLLLDRFDTAKALGRFHGPVAFVLAGEDEVVFTDLGRALHDGYAGPKRLWVQPGRHHNTLVYEPRDPMWREIVAGLLAGGW